MHLSRRLTTVAAAVAAVCALFTVVARPADADVGVTINGNAVDVEPAPITQAGRVFVPLRSVFEQLGASVVYSNGQINATGNGRNISLQIGSTQASVDGQGETIDVAPFIVGASTYVPLRFISESLGANVDWNDATSTVAITLNGAPQANNDENIMDYGNDGDSADYADAPPPPIPDYNQPPVPDQNAIWQPGYWAYGNNGYYWVPGTWVQPPQTGYLWTPGYWQANDNRFAWNPGYWAAAVGFYGGVNYGAGYYGNGYVGGRWSHNTFQYNTYVTHVNTSAVRNVYVDRNVTVVNPSTRVSYNGGPHGVQARPTTQQMTIAHGPHVGLTQVQRSHVQAAAHDPRLLASANHNVPPVLAVARPLSAPAGVRPAAPAYHAAPAAPQARTAPEGHAAPAAHPAGPAAYHGAPAAPEARTAPEAHSAPAARPAAPAAYHAAPAAPAVHAAPAAHPAAVHPEPAYHAAPTAPVVHAAPEAHTAPAAPAYHAAPAAPAYHAAPAAPVHAAPAAPAYHAAPAAPVHAAPAAPAYHAAPAPVYHAAPAAPVHAAPAAPAYHAAPAPAAPPAHAAPPARQAPPAHAAPQHPTGQPQKDDKRDQPPHG